MKFERLHEEITIELDSMETIVDELIALQQDTFDGEPSVRDKTAAAAFLAQFYTGIENILKRISYAHDVPLPEGESWHIELFKRFTMPAMPPLPDIFDAEIAGELAPYRRFRHVALHSYGFNLDWSRMLGGVEGVSHIFSQFKERILLYLDEIK